MSTKMTKKQAYALGFKNGLAGVYLPYNIEKELLEHYEKGYEQANKKPR